MPEVSVDKKNDKVFLEISIEEAFATLASLAFSRTGKSYDLYCKLLETLGRPNILWNPASDNFMHAVNEQQNLVENFKKNTFTDVPNGYCFRVINESHQRLYVKSSYPNNHFNSYFIFDNSLIHVKIDELCKVEILGKANFYFSYQKER